MKLIKMSMILAGCFAALYASYVVEWSAPVSYSYAYVYSGNQHISYDVNGDSIPDVIVSDSSALKIYSGVTHNLIWTIPTSPYNYFYFPYITNTDGDANKELVILVYRLNGAVYASKFFVYDCQTHNQEYASPEKSGYPSCAVADVDGDNKSEICLISGNPGSRILEVYGSTDIDINESVKPKPIHNISSAIPNPTKHNVQFNITPLGKGTFPVLITDITGRVVRTLPITSTTNEGVCPCIWDCCDDSGIRVPAGTYFFRCGNNVGKLGVVE
jgi:hypothetical protein